MSVDSSVGASNQYRSRSVDLGAHNISVGLGAHNKSVFGYPQQI